MMEVLRLHDEHQDSCIKITGVMMEGKPTTLLLRLIDSMIFNELAPQSIEFIRKLFINNNHSYQLFYRRMQLSPITLWVGEMGGFRFLVAHFIWDTNTNQVWHPAWSCQICQWLCGVEAGSQRPMAHQLPVRAKPRISGIGLLNSYRLWHCLKAHINQIHKRELCFNCFVHVNLNSRMFFSVTCRTEIVIAYGSLYDHSSKRPKITQFFAGKAPPADGKAAPPAGKAGAPTPAASGFCLIRWFFNLLSHSIGNPPFGKSVLKIFYFLETP